MASFPVHLSTSTTLGVLYGIGGLYSAQTLDWSQAVLAAGLTAVGGIIPDLDSDSGKPVREMSSLAGAFVPLLMIPRLQAWFPVGQEEKIVIIAAGFYLFCRFILAELFNRYTIHRGMFHSIPAMLICGFAIFHLYDDRTSWLRYYMALGMMIGFLSHLVLDEIYAVDFHGVIPKLNHMAGSALKLFSKSWGANVVCYSICVGLGYLYWIDSHHVPTPFVKEQMGGGQTIRVGPTQFVLPKINR